MRINSNNVGNSNQVGRDVATAKAKTEAASNSSTASQDKATLSSDSSGIKAMVAEAMKAPESRQQKVEALRQQVQSGSYKVDHEKVADAMIKEYGG